MIEPAFITGTFTIILSGTIAYLTASKIASRNANLEHQRQVRELGMQMALAKHKFIIQQAEAEAIATGKVVEMYSLPLLVAEGIRIAEIVSNKTLNPYEIGVELSKMSGFCSTVSKGSNA